MRKACLLMIMSVLFLMPVSLFAGGKSEESKKSDTVVLWSEVSIKVPQTNLDKGLAKAVEGIDQAIGAKLDVVTIPPYKVFPARIECQTLPS